MILDVIAWLVVGFIVLNTMRSGLKAFLTACKDENPGIAILLFCFMVAIWAGEDWAVQHIARLR